MTITPTTQRYTFDAYLALDAEQRCELVDGELLTMIHPLEDRPTLHTLRQTQ